MQLLSYTKTIILSYKIIIQTFMNRCLYAWANRLLYTQTFCSVHVVHILIFCCCVINSERLIVPLVILKEVVLGVKIEEYLWTDWMTIFIWIIRYPRKRLGIYYAHYKSYRFNSIVCKQFVIYQKDECLIYVLYYHTKPKSSFWKTFFFLQTAWFNLNQRCIDIFFFWER